MTLASCLVLTKLAYADPEPRVFGQNRYDTNIEVVRDIFGNSKDTVVVTSGQKFPDALSAYNFAKVMTAPIILMDSPSDSTFAFLDELGVEYVYIVGGPNTVSEELENQLKKKYLVSRTFGKDRYETSLAVYHLTCELFYSTFPVRVTGEHFQEPLIATTYASNFNLPILLDKAVPRYALDVGDDHIIAQDDLTGFNDSVMNFTEGDDYVLAQIKSFPDSLSAVNYSLKDGYKIFLVDSIAIHYPYSVIVGGPNTLKFDNETILY